VPRPRDWLERVNAAITEKELARLRQTVSRGQPYGDAAWVTATAKELGLEHTLRSEGRPPTKAAGDADEN